MTEAAALLIDADNLSADGMREALATLRERNFRISVRRAYGSHETLANCREFLSDNSVRALINHGKGTTDALLVMDAMDLLHAGKLPHVVAIGSGDADFAPLVVRLREAGHSVICLTHRAKAAEGLDRFYEEVIPIDGEAPRPAKKTVARKTKPAASAAPGPVRAILERFPGFLEGKEIELSVAVKKLRDEKLMGKTTGATTFFKKHAPEVELLPPKQPHKLRLASARS